MSRPLCTSTLVCLFNHLSTLISMSRRKHTHNEKLPVTAQNKFLTFVDGFLPKKLYFSVTNTHHFTSQEIQNIQWHCKAQQLTQVREKEDLVVKKEEKLDVKQFVKVFEIQVSKFCITTYTASSIPETPSFLLKSHKCSCMHIF